MGMDWRGGGWRLSAAKPQKNRSRGTAALCPSHPFPAIPLLCRSPGFLVNRLDRAAEIGQNGGWQRAETAVHPELTQCRSDAS